MVGHARGNVRNECPGVQLWDEKEDWMHVITCPIGRIVTKQIHGEK
jgi:hypothetical protein